LKEDLFGFDNKCF